MQQEMEGWQGDWGDGVRDRRQHGWPPGMRDMQSIETGADAPPSRGRIPWLETVADGRAIQSLAQDADGLAALTHDARNMVAAMDLYCDLLEEPGVLATPFRHYARELRLVGGASRRLLEKMARLSSASQTAQYSPCQYVPDRDRAEESDPGSLARPGRARSFAPVETIGNLAESLIANQNLLAALAGPRITLGLSIYGGQRAVSMHTEDLTRVLVNLCRNAAEAMPEGGHIQIDLEESPERLLLRCIDSGPGIPESQLETIFAPGFTTNAAARSPTWPAQRRGLGLSIVRSLVVAAGGSVWAANRSDAELAEFSALRSPGSPDTASLLPPGSEESKTISLYGNARSCGERSGLHGAVISIAFPLLAPSSPP